MKSADIIKMLKDDVWYLVHVVGPHPKKDLLLPTVRSILKQAGL
jgi:predicted RNA binding protein YcfA (HicA-like mRNA interferase family)